MIIKKIPTSYINPLSLITPKYLLIDDKSSIFWHFNNRLTSIFSFSDHVTKPNPACRPFALTCMFISVLRRLSSEHHQFPASLSSSLFDACVHPRINSYQIDKWQISVVMTTLQQRKYLKIVLFLINIH